MMRRFIDFSLSLILFACLILASERRAWAYVDPGTGLLALQGFASVMAGVGFYLRRRILNLFGRKQPIQQESKLVLPAVADPAREVA